MMCELTQRTLCSCKPPAGASCQQNCPSSEDLRRKRSQGKRQMRNRMICTQQRGTFFKRACEASSAAHPHSTGSLLPWQETCWLHYYCCHVIQLWSQFFFWWIQIFFPKSGIILQTIGPLSLHAKTSTYTILYPFSDHILCQLWKENLRDYNFKKCLSTEKAVEKLWQRNDRTEISWRNLLSVVKGHTIFDLFCCLFWGFRVDL